MTLERTATIVGTLLPPSYVALALVLPASQALRAVTLLVFITSGALIGHLWAPLPTLATVAAIALAEEANFRGVGPGTRMGTVIEIHATGSSLEFVLFTMMLSITLPVVGLGLRAVVPRPWDRSG